MTKEEAIKYLRQIYPYGGHCWLDEQRIEAIDMAVKALQEEPTGNLFDSIHAEFRTAVESLGISQEEHDRIVDECIYGKEPELVDADDLPKEEPVSKDLEEAVNAYIGYAPEVDESSSVYGKRQAFKSGAKWQKEHLWKPADGDDLPEIDMEVIVLVKYNTQRNIHDEEYPTYRVEFGHRPNPNGWDGKSIATGKVEHYTPKTYDKGGWNIPNIKYWLDVDLPKEI